MITPKGKEGKKRRRKRWLSKHPEYVLKALKKWIEKEKDPKEKKRAKGILKQHLKDRA